MKDKFKSASHYQFKLRCLLMTTVFCICTSLWHIALVTHSLTSDPLRTIYYSHIVLCAEFGKTTPIKATITNSYLYKMYDSIYIYVSDVCVCVWCVFAWNKMCQVIIISFYLFKFTAVSLIRFTRFGSTAQLAGAILFCIITIYDSHTNQCVPTKWRYQWRRINAEIVCV